ncbi:calcium uptake protein 3, mitochondrial isoform X2 [Folsomia candida]|uniref:calcium uptake protein 3, mitochondrial isoform X2 n=1 Tax=Folsomia candida TaxID=158441 RepID=UPI001604FC7C|nr:calcium uptake protein 3, mitochondrial isoform X2 [Folsomia candida]
MSLSRRYLRVVLQGWRGGGGQQRRDFSWQPRAWSKWQPSWIGAVVTSASVVYLGYQLFHPNRYVYALKSRTKKDDEVKSIKLTSRERRFLRFASVEFDGQLYMTPQDFLESVVEAEPRPRLKRKALTKEDLKNIKEHTPALQKGSPQLWRNLRDKGVISYTEYLFLLSILTKPQTGFRIAFNMFDTDGNEKVDKTEFLVLLYLIPLHSYKSESMIQSLHGFLEKIFSMAWKDKRGLLNPEEEKTGDEAEEQENTASAKATEALISEMLVDDDRGLQRRHMVDTTLLVHFFGPKGNREIKYEDFRKFMEDLQTEVQELEFHEFSKGLDFISQVDFAKILLRYTYLQSEEYELYLDRLVDRIKLEQGITFEEFRAFCQFLNNLDDFNVAMKMYTLADRPISQDEFRRAVRICTGTDLSPHVVETVFQIFDEDDDGHLSHREFIGVMKDRLHRGFKLYTKNEGWEAFKQCIRQEMKTQ